MPFLNSIASSIGNIGKRRKRGREFTFPIIFPNPLNTSVDSTAAADATAVYGLQFLYSDNRAVLMIRYCSAGDVGGIVSRYNGTATPAPLAPNTSNFVSYRVDKLSTSTSDGIPFTTKSGHNWTMALNGHGPSPGYVKGALNPSDGQYTFFSQRTFFNGGVCAILNNHSPTTMLNDTPTRNRVILLAGSGNGGGSNAGGPVGGTGESYGAGCRNASGGGGGSQNGAGGGGGGPHRSGTDPQPGSGFAGGQGAGNSYGPGYDGWYGGGGGGADGGDCRGAAYGGGGSSYINTTYLSAITNSNYGSAGAPADWWWGENMGYNANGYLVALCPNIIAF